MSAAAAVTQATMVGSSTSSHWSYPHPTTLGMFFNTEIRGSGVFASIGNFGLIPFRYLFDGNSVTIALPVAVENRPLTIVHIPSFTKTPYSCDELCASLQRMVVTVVAVVLLIPGLLLSVSKLIAYAFDDVEQLNADAKRHFTPVDLIISQNPDPITQETLEESMKQAMALWNTIVNTERRPVATLTIVGERFVLCEDLGLRELSPKMLILVGGTIDPNVTNAMGLGVWSFASTREDALNAEIDVNGRGARPSVYIVDRL